MGLLKQFKDMKKTVEAAPGMIQQAQALGGQAQQMGFAQGNAMQQASMMGMAAQAQANDNRMKAAQGAAAHGIDVHGGQQPIEGVTLQQFAAVSKGLAAHNYDQTKATLVASQHGISAPAWEAAAAGWNGRITADPSVAQAFNAYYRSI